jgi:hypothetical protein
MRAVPLSQAMNVSFASRLRRHSRWSESAIVR